MTQAAGGQQTGTGPGAGSTTMAPARPMTWAPIPAWQIASLEALAAANKLSGVPPQILAVIVTAESGGNGGGINSEGYGGFFGLTAATPYPGGSVTTAQLQANTPTSFEAQAIVAASDFAGLLQSTGGNAVTAEYAYQNGPNAGPGGTTEGSSLMAQYTGGQTIKVSGAVGAGTVAGSGSSGAGSGSCTPVISYPKVLGVGGGALLNSCQVKEIAGIALMGVGGLVVIVGIGVIVALSKGASAAQAIPGPVGTTARVASGQGRQVGAERRQRATRAQAQSDSLERTAARGSQTRRNQVQYDEQPFDK